MAAEAATSSGYERVPADSDTGAEQEGKRDVIFVPQVVQEATSSPQTMLLMLSPKRLWILLGVSLVLNAVFILVSIASVGANDASVPSSCAEEAAAATPLPAPTPTPTPSGDPEWWRLYSGDGGGRTADGRSISDLPPAARGDACEGGSNGAVASTNYLATQAGLQVRSRYGYLRILS
jgi:hypothetical protein